MTDEEKKAIKEAKHFANLSRYWRTEEYEEEEITEYIKIILNLIEKQQKEIEELKEINKEHQLLNGALGFKIGTLESEIEELKQDRDEFKKAFGAINNILIENYIPKQKITDKVIEIKHKKVKDMFITSSQGKLDTIIELESLLENEDIEKHIPRID